MQQLSLEQLEVESYAIQPSEQELTDLKGGAITLIVGAAKLYAEGYQASYDVMSTATTIVGLGGASSTAYSIALANERYQGSSY